jgi:putative hydrolase of the HAD superfamily
MQCRQGVEVFLVFFDIDGTLLDHDYAEHAGVSEFYRIYSHVFEMQESDFVQVWMELSNESFERYLAKEITFQEQRRVRMKRLFAYAGRALSDDEADKVFELYLHSYRDNWRGFSDVLPCLNSMQNITLGIISNGEYDQQVEKLKRINVRGYFAYVVTSSSVRASKPDPQIFIEACRQAGRKPEECFYVGDKLDTDAHGSNRVGMKGIWLDRTGRTHGSESGISVINCLGQVVSRQVV